MPTKVAPMMATLSAHLPPDDRNYAFEYKWDGVRMAAFLDRGRLRLQTRNLLDATRRYPELSALADALSDHQVILDGEIVALDDLDRPSFARLQRRMHLSDAPSISRAVFEVPIFYVLFDVLHLDGRDTRRLPYTDRRAILEELSLVGPCWQVTSAQVGGGQVFLDGAKSLGLEGVVAKRLDGKYEPGRRSTSWLKLKLVRRQEFVIGGWQEQIGEPNRIGALLVGYYEPPTSGVLNAKPLLRYAGRVGSGFGAAEHVSLMRKLRQIETTVNPFADALPRDGTTKHYVEPVLVGEVEYRGWTDANVLRQPAFKGLREDKAACEVMRE